MITTIKNILCWFQIVFLLFTGYNLENSVAYAFYAVAAVVFFLWLMAELVTFIKNILSWLQIVFFLLMGYILQKVDEVNVAFVFYAVAAAVFLLWLFENIKNEKNAKYNYRYIDAMSGYEFEHFCAQQLKRTGKFKSISVTSASGDYGADIVAIDNNGVKCVYQCKKYSSKLGNKPIQEIVASMAYYKAKRAGVITNSQFTENARILAKKNGVELIEGEMFYELQRL